MQHSYKVSRILLCIVCAINTAAVLAQNVAPGDEPQVCLTLREIGSAQTPNYDPSMGILMDSDNYQDLLPPRSEAVWQQVDNDVNNNQFFSTNVSSVLRIVAHNYTVDLHPSDQFQ